MTGLTKFVLFAFIAVVLLLVGLWLVGGKQRVHSAQIMIDAKPSVVFNYLYESNLRKKWVAGLQGAQLQTDPPAQLDSVFRSTYRVDDYAYEAEETIIRFEAGELVVIRCRAPHAVITSVMRLEAAGDMTRFSYDVTESLHGLARFRAAIAKSKLQEQLEREVLALKNAVETQRGSGVLDDDGDESDALDDDANDSEDEDSN